MIKTQTYLNQKHLMYFKTVIERGSVQTAAKVCGVGDSTISEGVKKLETDLGTKLFRRDKGQLGLTNDGKILYKHALEILNFNMRAVQRIQKESTGEREVVYLGLSNTVEKSVALDKLNDLIQFKKIKVVFKSGEFSDLLHDLLTDELDLLLSDGVVPEVRNVIVDKIGHSEMVIAYPKSKGKLFEKDLTNAMRNFPYFSYHEGGSLKWKLEQFFEENGIRPQTIAESDNYSLLLAAVSRGEAFAIVPREVFYEDVVYKNVMFRPIEGMGIDVHASYVNNEKSKVIEEMLKCLK